MGRDSIKQPGLGDVPKVLLNSANLSAMLLYIITVARDPRLVAVKFTS